MENINGDSKSWLDATWSVCTYCTGVFIYMFLFRRIECKCWHKNTPKLQPLLQVRCISRRGKRCRMPGVGQYTFFWVCTRVSLSQYSPSGLVWLMQGEASMSLQRRYGYRYPRGTRDVKGAWVCLLWSHAKSAWIQERGSGMLQLCVSIRIKKSAWWLMMHVGTALYRLLLAYVIVKNEERAARFSAIW